jgi:hypothetical protein
VLLLLDRVAPFMTRLLPAWLLPARLLDVVMQLSADARTVFLRRRVVGPLLLLAIGAHLVAVVMMAALAYGLGMGVNFGAFMVLVPPAVLASLVPLSFAGWGVREGAMVALLGSIGIVPEEALALSVAYGWLPEIVRSRPSLTVRRVREKDDGKCLNVTRFCSPMKHFIAPLQTGMPGRWTRCGRPMPRLPVFIRAGDRYRIERKLSRAGRQSSPMKMRLIFNAGMPKPRFTAMWQWSSVSKQLTTGG